MPALSLEKQREIKDRLLEYPDKSDREIAKMVGLSQPTVSKYHKEIMVQVDSDFIHAVAGKFIQEFAAASDHWKKLIGEVEVLKGEKKTIFKKSSTGQTYPEDADAEPLDKLQMIKQQSDLRAKILFLASQGEVREVIKTMRNI